MVIQHHWLNGHEFEQALGNSEGQGSLAFCRLWGAKNQTWLRDWTSITNTELYSWPESSNAHTLMISDVTSLKSRWIRMEWEPYCVCTSSPDQSLKADDCIKGLQ